MIGYLKGKILDHADGKMLVGVGGEDSAVGYSVSVPQSAAYGGFQRAQSVELFIYTHVREDSLDLYGFLSPSEKELYMTLLSVTGIGPKGAMSILAGAEPLQLIEAITSGDKGFLTSLPGVGKKTAERVVLELADPLRRKMENGTLSALNRGGGTASSQRNAGLGSGATGQAGKNFIVRDARAALLGLGYRDSEISMLLNRIASDSENRIENVESLIRLALRELSGAVK